MFHFRKHGDAACISNCAGKFTDENFEFKLPKPAVDVFGRSPSLAANELVICIVCGREFAANRYAAHLEKCVGKVKRTSI